MSEVLMNYSTDAKHLLIPATVWALPLFITVSLMILLWRKRNIPKDLPTYDQIPSSILSRVANKKVLAELSGNVDVIVVGSGIAGLSTAACLSRVGYKVLVLEQHYTVGGSTHTYSPHRDKNATNTFQFDVGVHYVGGQLDHFWSPFRQMFNFLSDSKLEWNRLSDIYDVAYNAETGERLEITGDKRMTRKVFLQHFPHLEAKALDKYYRRCYWARQVAFVVFFFKMLPPFVTRLCWPSMTSLYHKTCLPTTISVMNECGLPPDVIGALLYCWGDYGTPPGESPFFMQAFMESHYDGGAYFPKGGSSSIAKTLVAAILRRGGQVFANSPVERILVQKNWFGKAYQAVGVRVRGVDIRCKKVVSDAGFKKTFGLGLEMPEGMDGNGPLVDQEAGAQQWNLFRDVADKEKTPFKSSQAFFYLFIGLDGTDKELHLPAQNIWHHKGWDHDKNMEVCKENKTMNEILMEEPPMVFMSNESAKYPETNHNGKATVTMVAWANRDWFRAFSNTTHGNRGAEYEEFKEGMAENLLEVLYKHFPKTKGKVEFAELGTPLTVSKFLGHSGIYELNHDVGRFTSLGAQLALHPQTTVKNLYMCGQDVLAVGIVGATMSGFLTCARVNLLSFLTVLPALFAILLFTALVS